jgi:long-subunit fatty acid transport protein
MKAYGIQGNLHWYTKGCRYHRMGNTNVDHSYEYTKIRAVGHEANMKGHFTRRPNHI